ncbi:AI-2E family transporter [Rhizobium sp. AC44/96]|uniref:AI-2E family transporter n=1 Tax=Rhizobium sp. AC44/96 TaxID=1841654 RepID=UPI0031599943
MGGMILPLFLALAIAPGWSLVAWVAGLFIVTELVSNNVVEPWLYGSHTGLSPLAIIVSAIFWSWLWGPVGLMLSTPLTVCLVVLGRYVPQFNFLDVLLGNEPVLEPQEKLYQRLLAGDPNEATDNAEQLLEEEYLVDYYEKVALPALILAETDRQRGVMTREQIALFASTTRTLIDNLAETAVEEENEEEDESAASADGATISQALPDGEGRTVLSIGGRGAIDAAGAAMLAQLLSIQGAELIDVPQTSTEEGPTMPPVGVADTAIITFLNGNSMSHARQIIRRLKRQKPGLRVGVMMPTANGQAYPQIEADDVNAGFVCTTMSDAIKGALTDTGPARPEVAVKKLARPRVRRAAQA